MSKKGITKKQKKFVNEYFVDFNASAAAIRAGYAEASARQQASRLLSNDNIKKEIAIRLEKARLQADDVIKLHEAMAMGVTPTKIVTGSHAREEYDMLGAGSNLGKIHALFKDSVDLNISHLNITDEDDG